MTCLLVCHRFWKARHGNVVSDLSAPGVPHIPKVSNDAGTNDISLGHMN